VLPAEVNGRTTLRILFFCVQKEEELLGDQVVDTETDLRETGYEVTSGQYSVTALVNTVMHFLVPLKLGHFLTI
jgi:hypothetical protein